MDVDVDADMDSWATVTISTSSAQATKILAWIYGKAQIIVFIFDAYIAQTYTQWHEGASVCVCKYKMTAIYPDAACSADVALWERFMGFTCVQVGA